MDQLPRLEKRELIGLLLFTCNYVVFVWRGFLFLWVLGMGYVILLWHSLSLPYNYFTLHFKIVFSMLFVKIRCELSEIRGTEGYLLTFSAMTFTSRRHNVTSIEHNVDQS